MRNVNVKSTMQCLTLAILTLTLVACINSDESGADISTTIEATATPFVTPTPTPVIEERDDCSVHPGQATEYEQSFSGPQPGRILFEVEKGFSVDLNQPNEKVEVWAVDDNGDNLTNLTYVNGTTPTGLTKFDGLAVSRDGLRLAFVIADYELGHHISVMDTYGKGLTQITFPEQNTWSYVVSNPVWSADASHLAFSMSGFDSRTVPPTDFSDSFIINVDGLNVKQLVSIPSEELSNVLYIYFSFSPDNKQAAFSVMPSDSESATDNYFGVQNQDDGTLQWALDGVTPSTLKWSPNGKMIAFEAGGEVYVFQSDGTCHLNISSMIREKFEANPDNFVWSTDSQSF